MSKTAYPIVRNCNFESRDDAEGQAIHAARKAIDSGRCGDQSVIGAMASLESVLTDHADNESMESLELCRDAERAVVSAWNEYRATETDE